MSCRAHVCVSNRVVTGQLYRRPSACSLATREARHVHSNDSVAAGICTCCGPRKKTGQLIYFAAAPRRPVLEASEPCNLATRIQVPSAPDTPLSPFNEGDIIIRSGDNSYFLMYKLDLSRASPVFKTMLSLPQPATTLPQEKSHDGLPVVAVTESAATLKLLLALCTPVWEANISLRDIDDVLYVLEAARKYEMEWLVAKAREVMRGLAEKTVVGTDDMPVRVYAVACRFGLKEEAAVAARCCLRLRAKIILSSEVEELDFATATQFRRLMNYRDDCQKAVETYLSTKLSSVFRLYDTTPKLCSINPKVGHLQAWKTRYRNNLTSALKDCVWEGAVRADLVFTSCMEVPEEICAHCPDETRHRLASVHERVISEIAGAISEVPFVFSDRVAQLSGGEL